MVPKLKGNVIQTHDIGKRIQVLKRVEHANLLTSTREICLHLTYASVTMKRYVYAMNNELDLLLLKSPKKIIIAND